MPRHLGHLKIGNSIQIGSVQETAPGGGGGVSGMKIGINMTNLDFNYLSDPFVNYIHEDSANYLKADFSGGGILPVANLDADRWPDSTPNGNDYIQRQFVADGGKTLELTWLTGTWGDTIQIGGCTQVSRDDVAKKIVYTVNGTTPRTQLNLQYRCTAGNFVKGIDIRDQGATGTFTPAFLAAVADYSGYIRDIKWRMAVEANSGITAAWAGGTQAAPTRTVTWANRCTPTGGDWRAAQATTRDSDGVPIEISVQFANECYAANQKIQGLWINIPWNADDAWITGVATYVRDNLSPALKCVWEPANEVWNFQYAVTTQAQNEGTALGFTGNGDGNLGILLQRYTQRANEMFTLINAVYTGSRFIRVLCSQPAGAAQFGHALTWANTQGYLANVDALATNGYFSFSAASGLDKTFANADFTAAFAALRGYIDDTLIGQITTYKGFCTTYGKTLLLYEGGFGQEITDQTTRTNIKTDSRMYDMYMYLFEQCVAIGVDAATLFQIVLPSTLNSTAVWGMLEYTGQTISKATTPAQQAVIDYNAGTRELFDLTYGTQSVALNAADGSAIGNAPTAGPLTGTTYSTADPNGALTCDPATGRLKVLDHTKLPSTGSHTVPLMQTNALATPTTHTQNVAYTVTAALNNTHAYRYYRLTISAVQQFFDPEVAEIEIAAAPGGADTTTGITATADSSNPSHPASFLIDNNTATTWLPNSGYTMPQHLVFDYGATSGNWIAANQLKITAPSTAGNAPKNFTFEGSDDNSAWTTLITQTNQTFTSGQTLTYTV